MVELIGKVAKAVLWDLLIIGLLSNIVKALIKLGAVPFNWFGDIIGKLLARGKTPIPRLASDICASRGVLLIEPKSTLPANHPLYATHKALLGVAHTYAMKWLVDSRKWTTPNGMKELNDSWSKKRMERVFESATLSSKNERAKNRKEVYGLIEKAFSTMHEVAISSAGGSNSIVFGAMTVSAGTYSVMTASKRTSNKNDPFQKVADAAKAVCKKLLREGGLLGKLKSKVQTEETRCRDALRDALYLVCVFAYAIRTQPKNKDCIHDMTPGMASVSGRAELWNHLRLTERLACALLRVADHVSKKDLPDCSSFAKNTASTKKGGTTALQPHSYSSFAWYRMWASSR